MKKNTKIFGLVVIAYYPDEGFYPKYERLAAANAGLCVVVYDNGGVNTKRFESSSVTVIGQGCNDGIGIAINRAISFFQMKNIDVCLTFDQDSSVNGEIVGGLIAAYWSASSLFEKVACVGPLFYDERNSSEDFSFVKINKFSINKIYPYMLRDKKFIESDFIITSGMVVNMKCLVEVGLFNENLFIDYVDTEWCLRARSRGYGIYGALDVRLPHSLSDKPVGKVMGRLYLEYSDTRRYYQTRNSIILASMKHVPAVYGIYLLATSFYRMFVWSIKSKDPIKTLRYVMKGFKDGFTGRSGKLNEL